MNREPDTIVEELDPLTLDLKDDVLIEVLEDRFNKYDGFYKSEATSLNGLTFQERVERNKRYYLGEQLNRSDLQDYQSHYIDNLIYEGEGTIKPIAQSRLPDLLVKPGNESEESKDTADDLTDIVNSDIRTEKNRLVLGLAHTHLPIYFRAIIKAFWDPTKGEYGDYGFKVVHPDNFKCDHTVTVNDTTLMSYTGEAMEKSVKEVAMMFPKKEEELRTKVHAKEYASEGTMTESRMASKIKIWEVWFDWYKEVENPETGKKEWEKVSAILWKYENLVLHKMKNAYWDWTGKKRLFVLEPEVKREANDEDIRKMLFGEDIETQSEQFFFNYLPDPSKPYYIMGYNTLGEYPFDCTSRIEQTLPIQDDVNKRGRQITEMNDLAKGKHVFSTDSGITKTDVENMDFSDPNQDLVIDGRLADVHDFIPGTPAPPPLYTEQEQERQKGFAKLGTHSTTRGERKSGSQETATLGQVFKQSDMGRIDDLVTNTTDAAAKWMAQWSMQFIKLFYTKEHIKSLVGKDGDVTFTKISRDSVEDGAEVVVGASGVDKEMRKREAYEKAKMKMIDPISFFIDTDTPDPIGRARMLMDFILNPELYTQKHIEKRDTQQMGEALNQQPVPGAQPQQPGQPQPGQLPAGGGGFSLPNATQVSPLSMLQDAFENTAKGYANTVNPQKARAMFDNFLGNIFGGEQPPVAQPPKETQTQLIEQDVENLKSLGRGFSGGV